MTAAEFRRLVGRYPGLRIAVVGDFCLDRYLDIDPALLEVSLETGLSVYNVVGVRAQPGGAGTVLNNLAALGVGMLYPVGTVGDDGEGYELLRALSEVRGVCRDFVIRTRARRTFTYCKPLVRTPDGPPVELSRFDSKNWTRMPAELERQLTVAVREVAARADAVVMVDQVDREDTGVLTAPVREAAAEAAAARGVPAIADCRRGLAGYPPCIFKMNAAEAARTCGQEAVGSVDEAGARAADLAVANREPVFVTLAERGLLGAEPDGTVCRQSALPVRGPIDVTGAGDCVTASLIAALAAGAPIAAALRAAACAASVVIHQVGTTGTATAEQVAALLEG